MIARKFGCVLLLCSVALAAITPSLSDDKRRMSMLRACQNNYLNLLWGDLPSGCNAVVCISNYVTCDDPDQCKDAGSPTCLFTMNPKDKITYECVYVFGDNNGASGSMFAGPGEYFYRSNAKCAWDPSTPYLRCPPQA